MPIDETYRSPNYSSRHGLDISILVIHATAGNAKSAITHLTSRESAVSAHYLIDKRGKVYRLVPDKFAAWHAGISAINGETRINEQSIGIELENNNDGKDPYTKAQLDALYTRSWDLIHRYKIPRSRVVRHMDIAPKRKSDPVLFPWGWFVDRLFNTLPDFMRYRVHWSRVLGLNIRELPDARSPSVGSVWPWGKTREFTGRIVQGVPTLDESRWVEMRDDSSPDGKFVWYGGLTLVL